MARLSRHLASLPLLAKHRINCIRTAIKRNMEVQNYGDSKQMLELLLSKAPASKQEELRGLVDFCVQRGTSNKSIDPLEDPSHLCSAGYRPLAPAAKNTNTRKEPRHHAPIDKNGRKDGYMYVVNENNVPVSTLVVRGEGWNKWDAPKSKGEADSSADEEQPANRRRIEVILSQQTLSSDDENDDTPVLEDLRDVLKRKFEFENSNSSTRNDLRTTLNARKSRRISAVDPDPKERLNDDLRDKLNAGACDLRIHLNRSKPTDLRRRLEQTKMSNFAGSPPEPTSREQVFLLPSDRFPGVPLASPTASTMAALAAFASEVEGRGSASTDLLVLFLG
ncbi:hypothetical protein F2Q68_00031317 [Brassica cretica]|uniref:Uncharacterized protein n=1 Tax=Brassica cretica TaxID=69181 RepID=A0A8S9G905_BRACR|nr:hypothetical protein F2Q68_00031317 [Brassica cretica]